MNRNCCERAHSEVKNPSPKRKAYFSWQQLFIQLNSFHPALNKNLIPQVSHSPSVLMTDEEGVVQGQRFSVVLLPILGVSPEEWRSLVKHVICLYFLCCESLISLFSSPSEDTETVSNSSEGKCGSPHDLLETIFIRKVGAFVNKPINQVTSSRSSQRAPWYPASPICSYTEEQKAPQCQGNPGDWECVFLPAAFPYKVLS